jgi:chromosome segregation ATPase
MNENDELGNIPPMVPDRDDVSSHLSDKKAQSQDIVRPAYYTEKVKVSTWPVRIMLSLLTLAMMSAGYGSYYFFGEYQNDLRQADLRISDLERRLSLAGDSADDSAINMIDRMDFNFTEIDKLWAARRVINSSLEDLQSELAKLALVNEGQDEVVANNSQQIANTNRSLLTTDTRLNTITTEFSQLTRSMATLDAGVQELQGLRSDMAIIKAALNSGDSTVLGLVGRLEYIEESMESVNANRQQVNESLLRIQESIAALRRSNNSPGGGL